MWENVSFETRRKHGRGRNVLLDRILPHFTSHSNVKLLQGLLIRGVIKVEIVHVRELFRTLVEPTHMPTSTHECHFGGRLIARAGFEQERTQLYGSGERDADDAVHRAVHEREFITDLKKRRRF